MGRTTGCILYVSCQLCAGGKGPDGISGITYLGGSFRERTSSATIEAYSNCDSVLLYNDMINDKVTYLGRKKNNGTGTHFMWENRDIRYNYFVL